MKVQWRPEPVCVAIRWDDLWLVVICQPNLEIAGSPRKVYWDRGRNKYKGGRALDGVTGVTQVTLTKLRITLYLKRLDSHAGLSSCDERETTQTFV